MALHFSLRLYVCVVDSCCVHDLVVMYPKWGTIAQMYHDWDIFDFSQDHVTKNQPKAVPV